MSAVKEGLQQNEVLKYFYNFGSDVLHGRKARGIELCPPTDSLYARANLSRALLAVDALTSLDAELDIIAEAHHVCFAMKTLRRALEQPGIDSAQLIRTVLGARQGLKRGRHYTGAGTEDDPYVFVRGIPYYEAFRQLAGQLGLNKEQRRLKVDKDSHMIDVVPGAERQHFSLVPQNVLLPKGS